MIAGFEQDVFRHDLHADGTAVVLGDFHVVHFERWWYYKFYLINVCLLANRAIIIVPLLNKRLIEPVGKISILQTSVENCVVIVG